MNDWFTAASSGLTYDENMVTLRVIAGSSGSAPEVRTIPDESGRADGDQRDHRRRQPAGDDPPGRAHRADLDRGSMASGAREIWRQMTDTRSGPFAASVFHKVLESRGSPSPAV